MICKSHTFICPAPLKAIFMPLPPTHAPEGYLAMVSTYPVYIKNVSWEDDFGIPWPLPPACTRAICYEEDTR